MLVNAAEFLSFLGKLRSREIGDYDEIIVPLDSGQPDNSGATYWKHLTDQTRPSEIHLDGFRPVDPLKILFYAFREQVLNKNYESRKRIIAGVKACDLKGLQLLDRAMLNDEFIDPAYKHWRDTTLIISSDCTDFASTCHCTLIEGQPFPETGFDINLSKLDDAYWLAAGSEHGEALLDLLRKHVNVQERSDARRQQVQENRKSVKAQLQKHNELYQRSGAYEHLKATGMDAWKDASESCIGCGACTNICPTCYCLILNDESTSEQFLKERSYDSCQYNGYARVAGGASPRPEMTERFRHRYLCKLVYMNSNFGIPGCTGCGRCSDACAGKIEFREVVQRILEQSPVGDRESKTINTEVDHA